MRFISTRVHGVLDYLMGIVLIAAPWMLGFADNSAATWVPVLLGVGLIIYSLCTDYELGAFRVISMRGHLWLDGLSGVFLAASPWLFGFNEYVSTPHLVLGIVEVLAALTTVTMPSSVAIRDRRITSSRAVSRDTLGTRATPGLRTDISGEAGTGPSVPLSDRNLGRGTTPGSSVNSGLNNINSGRNNSGGSDQDQDDLNRGRGAVL